MEQIVFEEFSAPKYPKCFKTCKHFNEIKPDTFPFSKKKRCRYHDTNGYGTSGSQFYFIANGDGSTEMYCRLYEQ